MKRSLVSLARSSPCLCSCAEPPSRGSLVSCGPRQLWRTKACPARGPRACFGGRKSCVLFIVLGWDPGGRGGGGGALSPVELCSFLRLWDVLVWGEVKRSKRCWDPEAGILVSYLSGNRAAVGDDSECVSVEFSGSSKMYEGPHPVSSVNLIPWSLLLTVLCSSRTLSQVHWILIITLHLG